MLELRIERFVLLVLVLKMLEMFTTGREAINRVFFQTRLSDMNTNLIKYTIFYIQVIVYMGGQLHVLYHRMMTNR